MADLTPIPNNPIRILPIVEGHGEVGSVPMLLKRLAVYNGGICVRIYKPIRGKSSGMLKKDSNGNFGIETQINMALHVREDFDVLFIFIDADVLPSPICEFFPKFYKFCIDKVPVGKKICIVFPNKEFEAWFLGSMTSLAGNLNVPPSVPTIQDPESIRGAKERFRNITHNKIYDSFKDQVKFIPYLDFGLLEQNCRSFKKLNTEFRKILTR